MKRVDWDLGIKDLFSLHFATIEMKHGDCRFDMGIIDEGKIPMNRKSSKLAREAA